jgi:uncharacterized protein
MFKLNRQLTCYLLAALMLCIACQPQGANLMNDQTKTKIDWKALQFTCTKVNDPPLDPEAEVWYKLQDENQDKHINTIVELFKKAIERDHFNAMNRLSLLYVSGSEGLKPDVEKAVDLTERMVKLNVASGYYQMGVFLEQGIGVRQDRLASLTYMRKSADMGFSHGQLVVAKKLTSIPEKAEREQAWPIAESMLKCALGQGLGEAGYELALEYKIVHKDINLALHYYQSAAKLGHVSSLFALSKMFKEGKHGLEGDYGLAQDEQRAACYERLWREAEADKKKKFPDLDLICPLPPAPMP